jgi:hypothetical protein
VEVKALATPNESKRNSRQAGNQRKNDKTKAETRNGAPEGREGFGSILADKLRAALDQSNERS